jgi:hypothetical protein
MITGKTLIDWGYKPGPWFADAIPAAIVAQERGEDPREAVRMLAPKPPERVSLRRSGPVHRMNIRADSSVEQGQHRCGRSAYERAYASANNQSRGCNA